MAITKRILSGASGGKGIFVTHTAATGKTIHTAISGGSDIDEIWIYAVNGATASRLLTIEHGTTSGTGNIEFTVPSQDGLYLIVPGFPMNAGNVVKAFAASGSSITIYGYVNRITA